MVEVKTIVAALPRSHLSLHHVENGPWSAPDIVDNLVATANNALSCRFSYPRYGKRVLTADWQDFIGGPTAKRL